MNSQLQAAELYHLPGLSEPFSALSHLIGAVAFAILGFMLLQRGRGERTRTILLGIYAVSCVLLLSLSAVYHMVARDGAAHVVLERLDHSAIFLLIAGTFTPTIGILFRGWLRSGQLTVIWAAALTGITIKAVFFDDVAEWMGLAFYLGLGWCGCFSAVLLGKRFGLAFIRPLLWGGIAYSIGGIVDYMRWPTIVPRVIGSHEVLHIAVIVGAIGHWLFIWKFADYPSRTWIDSALTTNAPDSST